MMSEKLWYKNAVIYQLHVKCYCDSNGDGIGDFKGLTEKLDYIQALGCNAIWIQPFYPSPLKDDGYDIADYCDIHTNYGTLKDFRSFLLEAHAREIKVITELVINHTSDQHPWFQRARRAKPGSKHRDYYVWSETPEKYSEARIIFKDFEISNWTWDPVANAYYWHRFYSSQPDLNYDSPDVHNEIFKIVDFWMQMGVDGMRLDAIPYLYQREGTDCENLPETHLFLKKLRAYIDSKYDNRILLAEANQWPEQAAKYFGDQDECHMAYNFPVMPRLFMAIKMEDRFPIIDIMEQTPSVGENSQWAMFLRNHDELTLEMVTDEERDYMYHAYAKDPEARINLGIRRRLSPLLGNDRAKIELMNVLLFSLPGSPIIYYGDEIGMGDNFYLGDRDGVRTPMQWDNSLNAGFSNCNPQKLYLPLIIDPEYHHTYLNVKNQNQNKSSLLRWMRSIIVLREEHEVFGSGQLRFIQSTNNRVLVFLREYKDEKVLVVANLSGISQYTEIHLEEFVGIEPIDLFSLNAFALIKESVYGLTLGRYGYYWLSLSKSKVEKKKYEDKNIPAFICAEDWTEVFSNSNKKKLLNKLLPDFLLQSRWFRAKSKEIELLEISQIVKSKKNRIVFLKVFSKDGFEDEYCLPMSFISLEEGLRLLSVNPRALVCRIKVKNEEGFLADVLYEKSFQNDLLHMLVSCKKLSNSEVSIKFTGYGELKKILNENPNMPSDVLKGEQTNTNIVFNEKLVCKVFRRIDEGINPDFELVSYLYDEAKFLNVPRPLGVIEKIEKGKKSTIALIQGYIPNNNDAWNYTLNALDIFFQNSLSQFSNSPDDTLFLSDLSTIPQELADQIGIAYLETIALLGKRTGEMHLSLSLQNIVTKKEMLPEPFTLFYQKSFFQAMRGRQKKVFALLRSKLQSLDPSIQPLARAVLDQELNIINLFKKIVEKKININKIRIHGDYHLGQVLVTGRDLAIIDFEGEPLSSLSERRLKKCCFHDVASMIRSFHYALTIALSKQVHLKNEDYQGMATLWYKTVSNHFFKSYLDIVKNKNSLIPNNSEDSKVLIDTFLMYKAINELNYELNTRPEWVSIPLKGILMLTEELCYV